MLALAGMSRLLRAHLRTLLAVVPRFGDGWEELMLVVESSMAGGRHETAVAAVALLSNVLQVNRPVVAVQVVEFGYPSVWVLAAGKQGAAFALLLSNVLQVAAQRTSVPCPGAVSTSKGLPLCACGCHFLAAPTRRKGLLFSTGGPGPKSARLLPLKPKP